ncbi:response regulator transcription factor [Streptomyces sp. NPDC046859]|uniref:response regulator transcription factor n=1 Tax=Streptomyces sp. NPDC046859 TaxID=3155734 RepID=UPI0033FE0356
MTGIPAQEALRIVVADDDPVVRAGLTDLLSGHADLRIVAEAADGHEAQQAARRHRPDVILLDVRTPGMDGLTALPQLARVAPVLMLTYSQEPEAVREPLRRGACGYLVHGEFTADELVAAVREVKRGRTPLTPSVATLLAQANAERAARAGTLPEPLSQVQPSVAQSSYRSRFRLSRREAEIMDLIASGLSNQQIAATCFITEKTVKNHINRIFAKLHSTSRAEAAAKWRGTAPGSPSGRS